MTFCHTCHTKIDAEYMEGWCLMHEEQTRYFCSNLCLVEFALHLPIAGLEKENDKFKTIGDVVTFVVHRGLS